MILLKVGSKELGHKIFHLWLGVLLTVTCLCLGILLRVVHGLLSSLDVQGIIVVRELKGVEDGHQCILVHAAVLFPIFLVDPLAHNVPFLTWHDVAVDDWCLEEDLRCSLGVGLWEPNREHVDTLVVRGSWWTNHEHTPEHDVVAVGEDLEPAFLVLETQLELLVDS